MAITLGGKPDAEGKQPALRFDNKAPLKNFKGEPVLLAVGDLTSADTDSNLHRTMKVVLDLAALNDPRPLARQRAVATLAMDQNAALLPALNARAEIETDSHVKAALRETIAIIHLKSDDAAVQAAAAKELGELGSFASKRRALCRPRHRSPRRVARGDGGDKRSRRH